MQNPSNISNNEEMKKVKCNRLTDRPTNRRKKWGVELRGTQLKRIERRRKKKNDAARMKNEVPT